jgi:shikimate 5-dehydrogenase/3-dehydroquinate dehydratase
VAPHARRVVTLPGRTVEECRREAESAARAGAEWAEVRADWWTPSELAEVGRLFPSALPLLLTLRSQAEGGEGPDDPDERRERMAGLLTAPFTAVDFELQRDLCLVEGLLANATGPGKPELVYSVHLGPETTRAEVERLIAEPLPRPGLRKLVIRASLARAVLEWLPLVESWRGERPVFHTTGASAPLFRLWADRLRLPLVYASLPTPARGGPALPEQTEIDRLPPAPGSGKEHALLALLGAPVAQSPSPRLMERLLTAVGHPASYAALEHAEARVLGVVLEQLATRGFTGVNLTRPLKQAGMELAATTGLEAAGARCVNLLVFAPDGWRGENTDVRALRRRWREREAAEGVGAGSVLVLGAGGAARASLAAAELDGRPVALAARPSANRETIEKDWPRLRRPSPGERYDWVVHATPLGRSREDGWPPEWAAFLDRGVRVLDWVYSPASPRLAALCAERGASYEDGRRLLLYQAAESVLELVGQRPDEPTEREAWQACLGA